MMTMSAVIAFFALSGCTKSFCSNQDKANQIFAYYGDLFNDSTQVTDGDESTDNLEKQATNRKTLYTTITGTTYGYSLPQKEFNSYISSKVTEAVSSTSVYWTDGTFASLDATSASTVAKHVAMYAGITYSESGKPEKVADVWTNFDSWYLASLDDENIGPLIAPSSGYISTFKGLVNGGISGNTACISPTDQTFNQNGSSIYIEGKTWGQAFSEYGFLEGLFVWPLSFIVHSISEGMGNTGWAQILAIFVVTIIVRLFTVISTVIQSKTQIKQQRIQPQLNALQAKYPNSNTDKDQRQQMSMEQAAIMKKNKVHPLLPMLFLIIQFPLFICVWSALQGSASLASGSWYGLSLTTVVSTCFTSFASTQGAIVGILIFLFMTVSNVLSSLTTQMFTSWRTKKFGAVGQISAQPAEGSMDPAKTGKIMTYVMMAFIVFMGWSLPVGMGIYWIFGAVISIAQALLMEVLQTRSRHRLAASIGDGTNLAAIRRSKRHQNISSDKKKKEGKSDKPLWR
ncbi:MAG: YidC/Oxa1 family membrane protein insertase [Bacilli bacterium]